MQIHWKDGLPKDRAEDSTIEATLITSGLTSKFSAILRLNDGDLEATEEEMERIEEEGQAQAEKDAMVAQVGGGGPAGRALSQSAQVAASLRGQSQDEAKEGKASGEQPSG